MQIIKFLAVKNFEMVYIKCPIETYDTAQHYGAILQYETNSIKIYSICPKRKTRYIASKI